MHLNRSQGLPSTARDIARRARFVKKEAVTCHLRLPVCLDYFPLNAPASSLLLILGALSAFLPSHTSQAAIEQFEAN